MKREGFAIVECKIKGIFVHESLLYDESYIDVDKWNPLLYKFRAYTTTGQALGTNFKFRELIK